MCSSDLGYGIGSAATTLVGQSIGAQRLDLSKRFARLSTALGMAVMSCMGVVMFLAAPWMFTLLTPDPAIRELGAYVLRIEAFAEPLFAAAVPVTGKSVAVLQRFPQTAFPELHVNQLRVDGIGLQIPAGFRCRRPGFGFRLQGRQARGDVAHKRAGLRDTADESFILQKRKSMLDSGL